MRLGAGSGRRVGPGGTAANACQEGLYGWPTPTGFPWAAGCGIGAKAWASWRVRGLGAEQRGCGERRPEGRQLRAPPPRAENRESLRAHARGPPDGGRAGVWGVEVASQSDACRVSWGRNAGQRPCVHRVTICINGLHFKRANTPYRRRPRHARGGRRPACAGRTMPDIKRVRELRKLLLGCRDRFLKLAAEPYSDEDGSYHVVEIKAGLVVK